MYQTSEVPSFLSKGTQPRLAAIVVHRYPASTKLGVYQRLQAVASQGGFELGILHGAPENPVELPIEQRGLIGGGILVPPFRAIQYDAIEHFRITKPVEFLKLLAEIRQRTDLSTARLCAREDFAATFAYCRWMQAWQADVSCTFLLQDFALVGWFAKRLLGIPWVHVLLNPSCQPEYEVILPCMLRDCDRLIVNGDAGREYLRRIHPDATQEPARWLSDAANGPAAAVSAVLQQRPPAPPRPAAVREAFAPRTEAVAQPSRSRPFVIIGAERTGSNMLVGAAAAQSAIACAGEIFNPRMVAENNVHWIEECPTDQNLLNAMRRAGAAKLHWRLLNDAAELGATCAGFKLLYFQGLIDHRILSHLASLPDLRVVHLRRRDRLRRFLSHKRAAMTDSWHTPKGAAKPTAREPLALGPWECVKDFALIEMMELLYAAFFAQNAILDLTYEDLAEDLNSAGQDFARFLGIKAGNFNARSRKTGGGSLATEIANLPFLQNSMAGTRWSNLFHDQEATA